MACVSTANAAGYSCPTLKKYTSCSSGYYLNGTGAGNSCSACPSGCTCAGGTAAPVCCTNTCTSTRNTTSTSSGTEACAITNGAGTRSYTNTCNGYYTGGDNCAGGCSGCSSWARTSTGTCTLTSCNSGYSQSGNSCVCTTPCTSVSTSTTVSCTATCSVANGTCTCGANSGSQTVYGYYTSSGCASAGASCSGFTETSRSACSGCTRNITCNNGYYKNSSGTCSQCESGYYCTGGVRYGCPATTTSAVYHYNGPTVLRSPAGATTATQCYLDSAVADYWTFEFQYHGFYRSTGKCYYSASTQKYNNCENSKRFTECNAGYFINDSVAMASGFANSCTACSPGTYTAQYGHIGNYGSDGSYNYSTACTACPAGTYTDAAAATSCKHCPDYYGDNPTVGQTSLSGCQITVGAGQYLTTKNGTTKGTCPAGTYNPIHSVNYGSVSSCNTCPAGTYSKAGAGSCTACSGANEYQPNTGQSSCLAVPFGYTKTSNSAIAPITLNCPAGQFMWHWGGKAACESCHADYYCPGGTNIYDSGVVNSQNSAGIIPIYTCPAGWGATDGGGAAASDCFKTCGNSSVSNGYIPPNSGRAYYPNDCVYNASNTVCSSGYNLTSDNVCAQLCTAGITRINLGGGISVPLYKSKPTTRAIGVGYANQVCYGNLAAGRAAGAINVNIGGTVYHSGH